MAVENKTQDPTINKAVVILKTLSGDEKVKEIARLREKRLHDEASALEAAENRGIEKGEYKKAVAVTVKLLKRNFSIEDIADCSGLTVDEVTALSEKNLQSV